jgi:putative chitinase
MLNKTTFFAYARKAPFGNRLSQQQVEGLEAILAAWDEADNDGDLRKLAYILATAFHETGATMEPVREGFAKSDAGARRAVRGRAYDGPDPKTKEVYYGRGYVQLTWAKNYLRLGEMLGLDLYKKPDLALNSDVAGRILVMGMLRGTFTGKRLVDYFNDRDHDAIGARRIVNGTDKSRLIAGYFEQFLGALEAADEATPQPRDVVASEGRADSPSLVTDRSTLGAVTGVISAGGAGMLTSIDNLYALAAVGIVILCVILFLTGRLAIRRQGGV